MPDQRIETEISGYATALKKMGIGAGDRVALSMHNLPQLSQLYFALYRLGATLDR